MEIKEVTGEFMSAVINSGEEGTFEPRGLFIREHATGQFEAMDNSEGCAWVECFTNREAAESWLRGEKELVDLGGTLNRDGSETELKNWGFEGDLPERDETVQAYKAPSWAWDTIFETLQMDMESSSCESSLREEIREAFSELEYHEL